MTNSQRNLRDRVTRGVEEAIEKALDRHRRLGEPIAIWQSGKVVTLQPQQIPTARRRKRR